MLPNVKMKISELQPKQSNVDIEVEIISIEEPRTISRYDRDIRVANALVKDDSGEIKMTFWNEDIEKVKPGMKIKITNGYVNEFQGEKQLTSGKFGKFEVLGGDEKEKEIEEEKPAEEAPESPAEEQIKPNQEPEENLI